MNTSRILFSLMFLLSCSKSLASGSEYQSAFQPSRQIQSFSSFRKNIEKEFAIILSAISQEKLISHANTKTNSEYATSNN